MMWFLVLANHQNESPFLQSTSFRKTLVTTGRDEAKIRSSNSTDPNIKPEAVASHTVQNTGGGPSIKRSVAQSLPLESLFRDNCLGPKAAAEINTSNSIF